MDSKEVISIQSPLVSVLITVYNRGAYISDAISSVLDQTYTNFELIIVDDCSTDDSVLIAKQYEKIDDRLTVYVNENNLGDYPNRNKAASYAKGQYIKFLDADDTMYSWCLEAMVYNMNQFPDAAYGLSAQIGFKSIKPFPIYLNPVVTYATYFFRSSILVTGPTGAIIRRECFEEANGFSGKAFIGDTELWLKLSQRWGMIVMPPDLAWWRTHEEQQSKYEKANPQNDILRFSMVINMLSDENCPLDQKLASIAIRNQKNIRIRYILQSHIPHLKFFTFLKILSAYGFNSIDLLNAFVKNIKPELPLNDA
jgi:glycosyltransferase involved in cell wall biosynthesis